MTVPPPPNFLFGNGLIVPQLPPLEGTEARPSADQPCPLRLDHEVMSTVGLTLLQQGPVLILTI